MEYKNQPKSFWEEKTQQLVLVIEQLEQNKEVILNEYFKEQFKLIEQSIEKIYSTYAVNGKVSLIAMQLPLTPKEKDIFKGFINNAMLKLSESKNSVEVSKVYNYLSNMYTKEYPVRMDMLNVTLLFIYCTTSEYFNRGLDSTLPLAMVQSSDYITYLIQTGTGIGTEYVPMDLESAYQELKNEKFKDLTYTDRIWNNNWNSWEEMINVLEDNFIAGSSQTKVVNNLKTHFMGTDNLSYYKECTRLARTEVNNATNKGIAKGSINTQIVSECTFNAILDNRTSEICTELNGSVVLIVNLVRGVNAPPMHPHCRSYLVIIVDNVSDILTMLNNAGISYQYVSPMTYDKWRETIANPTQF